MSRRAAPLGAALAALLGLLALGATLAGVRLVPVLSGSMAPHLPVGSLALTTPVSPQQVRPGMVLAFRPPAPYDTGGRAVMHRVLAVSRDDPPGTPAWAGTRGDANASADPWHLALAPGTQLGRERFVVPALGRLLAGGRRTAVPVAAALVLFALAGALFRRPVACTCPGSPGTSSPATIPDPLPVAPPLPSRARG